MMLLKKVVVLFRGKGNKKKTSTKEDATAKRLKKERKLVECSVAEMEVVAHYQRRHFHAEIFFLLIKGLCNSSLFFTTTTA